LIGLIFSLHKPQNFVFDRKFSPENALQWVYLTVSELTTIRPNHYRSPWKFYSE